MKAVNHQRRSPTMNDDSELIMPNLPMQESQDPWQAELVHCRRGSITPEKSLSRQWSKCSLCSIDSCDEGELLPIPGRESHTSDMDQFFIYVQRVKLQPRFESCTPFSAPFWVFMKEVLQKASPVGYCELPDADETEQKGPEDNKAFLSKIQNTALINPINPQLIAARASIPVDEVLTELIYATIVGFVTMEWGASCESSGSSCCAYQHKQKRKSRSSKVQIAYCNGCRYSNAIEVLQKIKVTFHLNPDVFYVLAENYHGKLPPESKDRTYLYAIVPATFTGSGFRYSIGCGNDMIRPSLPGGRYRMHCPVTSTDNYLEVGRDATDHDTACVLPVHVSDLLYYKGGTQRKILRVEHGKIHMDIFTDTQSFFVCWILPDIDDDALAKMMDEERPAFVSAHRLMANPTYQSIFEDTETEVDLFNEAVRKMKLESDLLVSVTDQAELQDHAKGSNLST